MSTIICEHCGATAPVVQPPKRFCSRRCKERSRDSHRNKIRAERERLKRRCKVCGGRMPFDQKKYCSANCQETGRAAWFAAWFPKYLAAHPRQPRLCIECGQPHVEHCKRLCQTCQPIVKARRRAKKNEAKKLRNKRWRRENPERFLRYSKARWKRIAAKETLRRARRRAQIAQAKEFMREVGLLPPLKPLSMHPSAIGSRLRRLDGRKTRHRPKPESARIARRRRTDRDHAIFTAFREFGFIK
jgi:predicted nucleic acid-binding Zn ribbon protein